MHIKIVNVNEPEEVETERGGYKKLVVQYTTDKREDTQEKTLVSFKNPDLFNQIQDYIPGDELDVKMQKNGKFWNWVAIEKDGAKQRNVGTMPMPTMSSKTPLYNRNFETPAERALRQRYIIRQSSLSTAVALLEASHEVINVEKVLSVAEELISFVKRAELEEVVNTREVE